MSWEKSLRQLVTQGMPEVVALRRHLHAHPEPSGAELETSLHLYQRLGQLGLEVRMGPEGCGVLADFSDLSTAVRRIALRGDIDALRIQDEKQVPYCSTVPGVMHACGHDAHAAIVYGAARALAELSQQGQAPGPLAFRVILQPSEETATGAGQMIALEALAGIDAIFALHVEPARRTGEIALRSGAMTAHCDLLHIRIRGQGGHAARPHESKDPIAAAAQLISSLYQFVPRATDSHDAVVLTIGQMQGGENPNVIPDTAQLWGTMRTLTAEVRARTIQQIRQVVDGISEITGTQIEVDFQVSIPSVHNDAELTRLLWREAEAVVGQENVQHIARPSMGSEDFACYLAEIPGVMFRLGCAADLAAVTPLHTPRFDIDEAALEIGVHILARAVVMATQVQKTGRSLDGND